MGAFFTEYNREGAVPHCVSVAVSPVSGKNAGKPGENGISPHQPSAETPQSLLPMSSEDCPSALRKRSGQLRAWRARCAVSGFIFSKRPRDLGRLMPSATFPPSRTGAAALLEKNGMLPQFGSAASASKFLPMRLRSKHRAGAIASGPTPDRRHHNAQVSQQKCVTSRKFSVNARSATGARAALHRNRECATQQNPTFRLLGERRLERRGYPPYPFSQAARRAVSGSSSSDLDVLLPQARARSEPFVEQACP